MRATDKSISMTRQSRIKALAEVAFRVNDLRQMRRFYEEVLGLEVLGESPTGVLLKIEDGYGGHTQVLGLFDRSVPVGPERTTVDHIAFAIALNDYELEKNRLRGLGLAVEVKEHAWAKWRSLYFWDPEGNEVELVCFDPDLGQ
jgi:catechol-2,3-dioxygenase